MAVRAVWDSDNGGWTILEGILEFTYLLFSIFVLVLADFHPWIFTTHSSQIHSPSLPTPLNFLSSLCKRVSQVQFVLFSYASMWSVIHWSVIHLPGSTPLKKPGSPSSGIRELCITPHPGVSPSPTHTGMLTGLIMCRSFTGNHTCSNEFGSSLAMFRKHCFPLVLHDVWILKSLSPSPSPKSTPHLSTPLSSTPPHPCFCNGVRVCGLLFVAKHCIPVFLYLGWNVSLLWVGLRGSICLLVNIWGLRIRTQMGRIQFIECVPPVCRFLVVFIVS